MHPENRHQLNQTDPGSTAGSWITNQTNMKIFVDENEIAQLAFEELNMANPWCLDDTYKLAERMDMVWNEDVQMYEDVEHVSLRHAKRDAIKLNSLLNQTI